MGTDTNANSRELVREVGGLLERLQRRVALEALCDRGSSFGAELVAPKTAFGWVLEVSGEPCQWALTSKGGGLLETAQRRRGRQHEGEQRRCGVADAGIIEVNFVD